MYEREAIVQQLEEKLDWNKEILEECQGFIKRVIESRHHRVLVQQKKKFELLYQQKQVAAQTKETILVVIKHQTLLNGLKTFWTSL